MKGGVLFHDSADKAAKFINLCDAYHIPLLFLADVPGFMIGTKVERAGIIRHGAKMISAMRKQLYRKFLSLFVKHMVLVYMRWQVQLLNQIAA